MSRNNRRRRRGYSKQSPFAFLSDIPEILSQIPSKIILIAGIALAVIVLAIIVIALVSGGDDTTGPVIQQMAEPTSEPVIETVAYVDPEDAAAIETVEETVTEIETEPVADLETEVEATATPEPEPIEVSEATVVPQKKTEGLRSVHLRIIGDVMFHKEQLAIAKVDKENYDFSSQFIYVKDSLANADYTIANLETTVGKYKDTAYSGYPQFNTPESCLPALKDCGIDFFTMANNHMLDRWFEGMKQDVTLVEKYGFDHVGAYRSKEERNTPVIVEINGIKFGFVAYTHTTNTMENYCDDDVFEYGVPYLYKSDIASDIAKLREAGAELVVAFPHWGEEYVYEPDETQVKYAKKLAKAGADIIIGSHSHMVQKMQVINGKDANGNKKQVFLIYSMGNFISTMTSARTDGGIILDMTINEQSDGTFTFDNIGYVPIYVWKQNKQLYVLPIGKYYKNRPEKMNDEQYNRMMECYREITGTLGTEEFTVLSE